MMRRFFSVLCLLGCLVLSAEPALARERWASPDREYGSERQDEPPRRLRDLRLKEAIRYGDMSPQEARSPNRDYRRFAPNAGPQGDDDQGGRQRWRDAQRRALDGRR